ncbi:MAG: hypothetical protein AAF744_10315, partial [Pseudomonadota bacterium]
WQAQRASEEQQWWQSIAQQVPPGVLLLFLLATLGGLYRYNMRMVGFHNSRADALEFLAITGDKDTAERFDKIATALAADKVEFGKTATPTDQAVELARIIAQQK